MDEQELKDFIEFTTGEPFEAPEEVDIPSDWDMYITYLAYRLLSISRQRMVFIPMRSSRGFLQWRIVSKRYLPKKRSVSL